MSACGTESHLAQHFMETEHHMSGANIYCWESSASMN